MATVLCRNLQLSIELEDASHGEQILITLANGLLMKEVQECYPVSTNTLNKRYHRQEAMVIAMRRLITKATDEGLISISRGVSTSLSTGSEATNGASSSSITLSMPEDAS